MVLAMYTHSGSSIIIAFQVIDVVVLFFVQKFTIKNAQMSIRFLDALYAGTSAIVAAVTFLPLLKSVLAGSTRFMVGLKMSFTDYLSTILNSFSPLFTHQSILTSLILTCLILAGILIGIRYHLLEGSMLAASLIGVTAVEYLLFAKTGWQYFYPRYIIDLLPIYLITLSIGLLGIASYLASKLFKFESPQIASNVFVGGFVCVVILGSLSTSPAVYRAEKQDFRDLTQYLVENLGTNDAVTFSPSYYKDYYHYYYPENNQPSGPFQIQTDLSRFNNLYLVADKGADITGFTGVYGNYEKVRDFPGGLTLWKLKIDLLFNTVPLLNRDYYVESPDGQMIPSSIGWSLLGDGHFQIVDTAGQSGGNTLELRFDKEDDRVALFSSSFPVMQNRITFVDAMIEAENLRYLGASLSLEIKDRNGLLLTTFDSHAIKGNQGWSRSMVGGITPENATQARIVLRLLNPPIGSGTIRCREIHVYGDWQTQQITDPLREIPIPNSEFAMRTESERIAWWNIPANEKVVVTVEKGQASAEDSSLLLKTTGPGVDYMVTRSLIGIDTPPESQFVFQVKVKTKNLSGPKGMEIAIGWVGANGKVYSWSESPRLVGTNDWQTLEIIGQVPQETKGFVLVPLRLFDSGGAGESIRIDQVTLYLQGQALFNDLTATDIQKGLEKINLPDANLEAALTTGVPNWWKFPEDNLVNITLDDTQVASGSASLRAMTNGPEADYTISSPVITIEATNVSKFLFQVEVRTKNLSGPKGMEIAIGWIGENGKVFQWSESQRLLGTNDWQVLEVNGQIPENITGMVLVPLRIFDSGEAGEMVWIDQINLWLSYDVDITQFP